MSTAEHAPTGEPATGPVSAATPATANAAELAAGAERLRALHHRDTPLVVPNAWDAASARVLAEAGFPAIATGSSAVAGSLGYDDGERAPVGEMLAAAARITGAVEIPVTVDVEAGYGLAAPELVERLLAAGAAGCNLEDTRYPARTLADPAAQAARLAAVRAAGRAAGVDLVINARVDVYEDYAMPGATPAERLAEAVERAGAYLDAGADCVYPILATDDAEISELVTRIGGPVNILYRPGAPSLARLAELGVRRVSYGPGLHIASLNLLGRLAGKITAGQDPY